MSSVLSPMWGTPVAPVSRPRARARSAPAPVTEVRSDIAAGRRTIAAFAQRLGVGWRTVESAAYGWTWRSVPFHHRLPLPSRRTPGRCLARLPPGNVTDMRRRYRAGSTSFGQPARQYRVGESTVRNAVLGFT